MEHKKIVVATFVIGFVLSFIVFYLWAPIALISSPHNDIDDDLTISPSVRPPPSTLLCAGASIIAALIAAFVCMFLQNTIWK
jgi:hypothetical protein